MILLLSIVIKENDIFSDNFALKWYNMEKSGKVMCIMNEISDLIIVILENFFLVGILQFLCLRKKCFKEILIVGLILALEALFLTRYLISEEVKLILPLITLFVYSIYLTNGLKLRNFILVLSIFINLTIVKSLIILMICLISEQNFMQLANDYGNLAFMSFLSIIVLGLEYFYLEHRNMQNVYFTKKASIVLVMYTLITLGVVMFAFLEYINHSILWRFCFFIVVFCMAMLFMTLYLCILNGKYYEKNLEQSLRLEAYDYEDKYIDAITERTVEYNKLRHDMKNHFDIVESMINTSHIQEAKDYMEQISFDQGEHYVHVNHLVLNYILSNKTKLAKSHGIDLCSVIIGKPVTFIADVDYSILVGNLLDNAIEATIEAKENEVNLCLSFYEDRFVIEVKNCVVDKPKSKQLLTNKKDKSKHGIGLKNIKDIVEKYNGQDVIEVNGNVFYHMCILYKVDEK